MLSLSPATRIIVALEPVDMRQGFNGLYARVQTVLQQEPAAAGGGREDGLVLCVGRVHQAGHARPISIGKVGVLLKRKPGERGRPSKQKCARAGALNVQGGRGGLNRVSSSQAKVLWLG